MTAAIPRGSWVNLYKQLQREAKKFPQYNYRVFAQRRVREYFEVNKSQTDTQKLETLYKEGLRNLESIKRQVAIGTLYPHQQTVVEQKLNKL
ncbi:unnamed protein product [Caenorhabditis auriculariae]|uniref:Complex 1 LYR protein domain-containing protein n=1 Tax=Caenorhabditis auriculariae TaxID=2777116 RepID=A0A8S1HNI1_9PELO|nr:unnamed protein product [Caenorhabditis auriculariae]